MSAKLNLCLGAFLGLCFATATCPAQMPGNGPAPANGSTQAIPLAHLYHQFFLYEAHLERFAAAHPDVPLHGTVKDQIRRRIGLSEIEWERVAESSSRVEVSVRALGGQTRDLIAADRKACHADPQSCSSSPPNLAKIRALAQQRDRSIGSEIQALEHDLGPDSTKKLRDYLENDLAKHIRIVTIGPNQVKASGGGTQ